MQAKIDELLERIKAEQNSAATKIKQAKAPLQEKVKSLEKALQQAKGAEAGKIAQAKAPLEKRIASLEKELQVTGASVSGQVAQATKSLKDEKISLGREIERNKATIKDHRNKISSLKKDLDDLTRASSSAQQENIFLNGQLEVAQEKMQKIEGELTTEFARREQELINKSDFLMETLDEKEAQLKGKDEKIKVLTQEADELASDYFQILDKNVALNEKVKRLEAAGANL